MEGIKTFKGSWPWPWPWIRPYGIPSCISHRPLPIYQISLKSKKLFVDGRTDVRTDGHFPPSNIIRSTFRSRPKKACLRWHTNSLLIIKAINIKSYCSLPVKVCTAVMLPGLISFAECAAVVLFGSWINKSCKTITHAVC